MTGCYCGIDDVWYSYCFHAELSAMWRHVLYIAIKADATTLQ